MSHASSTNFSVSEPTSSIEQLEHGVTFEWLNDKQIIVVTSHDTARATVDTWINRSTEIIKSWPSNKPFLVAVDASDPNVSRSPYSQARLKELNNLRPDLKRFMALIPPKTYVMQLMQLGMKLPTSRQEMRIFFARDEAIRWLNSKL